MARHLTDMVGQLIPAYRSAPKLADRITSDVSLRRSDTHEGPAVRVRMAPQLRNSPQLVQRRHLEFSTKGGFETHRNPSANPDGP